MPLDINLFRSEKGGKPDLVRESEKKRGRDAKLVDEIIEKDEAWRKKIFEMEQLQKQINDVSKEVGQRKKADKTDKCEDLVQKSSNLKQEIPILEAATQAAVKERDALLHKVGNLVDETVPVNTDEKHNAVLRTWGQPPKRDQEAGTPGNLHHHQLMAKLDMYESKQAVEMAGHRAYFLKGVGVMLNMALQQYGMSFLRKRGYSPVQPPLFMRKDVMETTAELKDFEESLYRIPVKEGGEERDDLYLIATSEQPISALHRNEALEEKQLPMRYAGLSTCFRKEAGSSGRDMWGLFRVHQFEKVEQFCYVEPEKSKEAHEEMIKVAEEFYQSLEIPYRVVAIVSGALNDAAAKKYDLEAWFPGHGEYKELVSVSNCTDYQARAMNIRLGHDKKEKDAARRFVHLLNGTLVATERCMCCIVENCQTEEGIRVPKVLVPFMDDMEFIPFPKVAEETPKTVKK